MNIPQLNLLSLKLNSILNQSSFIELVQAPQSLTPNQSFNYKGRSVKALNSCKRSSNILIFQDSATKDYFCVSSESGVDENKVVNSRTTLSRQTHPVKKPAGRKIAFSALLYSTLTIDENDEDDPGVRAFWVKTSNFNKKIYEIPGKVIQDQDPEKPIPTGASSDYIWSGWTTSSTSPMPGATRVVFNTSTSSWESVGTGITNSFGDEVTSTWGGPIRFSTDVPNLGSPQKFNAVGGFYDVIWGFPREPFGLYSICGYFQRIPVLAFNDTRAVPIPTFIGRRWWPSGESPPDIEDLGRLVENRYRVFIAPLGGNRLSFFIKYTIPPHEDEYENFYYATINLFNGDVTPGNPDPEDWRLPIANKFVDPVGPITPCQDVWVGAEDAYLDLDKDRVYSIDLLQRIKGEDTLLGLIIDQEKDITAEMLVRRARIDGDSCKIQKGGTFRVVVPALGSDEFLVEGITYLPN